MSLLLSVVEAFSGLQTELLIFAVAFCTHFVLFGSYKFKPSLSKAFKTPPAESPAASSLARVVKSLLRQGACREVLVNAMQDQLKGLAPSAASAAILGLLDCIGRSASADLLAAVRDLTHRSKLPPSLQINEALLRGYLGLKLQTDFQEAFAEAEASVGLTPSLAALAMRAAIARSDLQTARSYLKHVASLAKASASSPSAAPQQLLQQLVQLAAQKSAVLELISQVDDVGFLSPSVLETALKECSHRDDPEIQAVAELARSRGLDLTPASYGLLIGKASSVEDAQKLFEEAAANGSLGQEVLRAAISVASTRSDATLAKAVLQNLTTAPSPGVAAGLISLFAEGPLAAGRNAEGALLEFYEAHLVDVDILADARTGRLVVEAALRRGRHDLLRSLLRATQESSRRVMLLKGLASQKRLADARAVFEACPEKTTSLCNALVDACVDCEDSAAADEAMAEAVAAGKADVVTYNTIIKKHAQCGDIGRARAAIETMVKAGLSPNAVTFNELMDTTIRSSNNIQSVWMIIDEMKVHGVQPNMVTCSILLKTIQQNSRVADVERTLSFVEPLVQDSQDEVMLSSICEACIRCSRTDLLQKQLKRQQGSQAIKVVGAHTFGSLIRAHGVLGDIAGAWRTWQEMRARHVVPTSITIGCMVEALVASGDPDAGYRLIQELQSDLQTKPLLNAVIYCSVLKGFCHKKCFDKVWALHKEMQSEQVKYSVVTFNALIDACARSGQMVRVTPILEEMARQKIEPNVVTYSTILKGYCQEQKLEKAFELLEAMRGSDTCRPDEITYNTLIDGCAQRGLWDSGMKLLEEMEEAGVAPSAFTLTVLVKLASRSKKPEQAFELCAALSKKYKIRLNMHVYNNLIQTCVAAQQRPRAIQVLEQMLQERVRPDARTYKLILLACVSAGEVQDVLGLVRVATGLKGGHPQLARFGPAAQPRGGLPSDMLTEILEGAARANRDERAVVQLLRDLKTVAGLKLDGKLLASLTSKVIRSPVAA